MQTETFQNVPHNDLKSYLRIAAISSKTTLRYLYIGTNKASLSLLNESFKAGLVAPDFESAKKLLGSEQSEIVDAIIIDLPYDSNLVKSFYFFLKRTSSGCKTTHPKV